MDPLTETRMRILPMPRDLEQRLRAGHPRVRLTIYDSPTGSLTEWQGHDIEIDCLLEKAALEEPDNVALSVALCRLNTTPMIAAADVTWGHPRGHVEASLHPPSGVVARLDGNTPVVLPLPVTPGLVPALEPFQLVSS